MPEIKFAYQHHKNIEMQVEQCFSPTKTSFQHIKSLVEMIEQHTRFEERILFPLIEQQMNETDWANADIKLASFHNAHSEDDYADVFWLKQK